MQPSCISGQDHFGEALRATFRGGVVVKQLKAEQPAEEQVRLLCQLPACMHVCMLLATAASAAAASMVRCRRSWWR